MCDDSIVQLAPEIECSSNNSSMICLTFENPLDTDCIEELKNAEEAKKVILVVDDDMTNIMVATSLLEDAGYQSHEAMNGTIAIDLIKKRIK